MERILLCAVPGLETALKERIRTEAEKKGFVCLLEEDAQRARETAGKAEILFSPFLPPAETVPELKWLCVPSAGVDSVISSPLIADGKVMLSNSSGAYGVTISEHVVMVILWLLRRQTEYAELMRQREWKRNLPVRSIKNSRVLLLGTGDIGQETARRLRAFGAARIEGMNRSGRNPEALFDRILRQEELDEALKATDIVILSLPGTQAARHVLDAHRLSLLPEGALIVNVGRGAAVETAALEKELRAGRLRAALDVFEQEPLPKDSSLWDCPNLLLTSHVAGNMTLPYTRQRIVELFLEDFEHYCAGQPLKRRVFPEKGY